MAYIIFVQPAVLSAAGMDFGAVLTATCLATAFAAALVARGVPGAFLWGILAGTIVALPLGVVQFHGVLGRPPSLAPTFLQLDIAGAFTPGMIAVVFVFFFLALFDSVGTLVGVGSQ